MESIGAVVKKTIAVIQSLQIFVYKHSIEDSEIIDDYQLSKWGYKELIDSLYEIIINRKCPKKRAVWICGVTNTGKTTMTRMIEEIFVCDILLDG